MFQITNQAIIICMQYDHYHDIPTGPHRWMISHGKFPIFSPMTGSPLGFFFHVGNGWETRHFEWVNHRKSSISVGQGFLGKL